MHRYWVTGIAAAVLILLGLQITGYGQSTDTTADLSTRVRERYDIVTLQQGVALVPREAGSRVRMIQIVDGVVTVDGDTPTGAQLRDRLGRDADLVLQISYLTLSQQRDLAGAKPGESQPPAPSAVERSRVTRGDRLRFGEPMQIDADERIEGDVFSFGGPVNVDGEITGDVTSFGGPVRLGPQAIVRGDVNVVGGRLDRAPGAQVLGRVEDVARHGPFRRSWVFPHLFGSVWSRLGSLVGTVARIGLLVLLALIAVAFGQGAIDRIAVRTAASPLRAGLIGLLAEILFLPVLILTCIVLAVSIVGIPLLALMPFVVLGLVLVMLVGFVGLAYQLGGRIAQKFGWTGHGPYATVAVGVLAIGALTLVAKLAALAGGFLIGAPLSAVGYFVEYVAWTVGFGAAILAWHERQRGFLHRHGSQDATAAPSPAL